GKKDDDSAAIKYAEPTVFNDEEVTMAMAQTLINIKPDKDEEPTKKRVAEETLLQESFKKLKVVEVSGSESTQDTPTNDPKEMSKEDMQNMLEIIPVSELKVEALHVKEDLDALWGLVKEKFSSAVPTVDKEKALWVELKRLFEPDADDVIWKLQRHDMYMLTEKDYPLSNRVMTLMLSTRLQVEEDSEMAGNLVIKIFMKASKPNSRSLDTSSKHKVVILEALKGLILKIPGAITLSLFTTVDSREEGAEFEVASEQVNFHQEMDLIFELNEVAAGCTKDILRPRDCLDRLSEISWVVPTFVVIEGEDRCHDEGLFGVSLKMSPCFRKRFYLMLLETKDIVMEFCSPSWWKELSKETSNKILSCGDGSCVGLDPRNEVHGRASILHQPDGVRSKRYHIIPFKELNGVLVAFMASAVGVDDAYAMIRKALMKLMTEVPRFDSVVHKDGLEEEDKVEKYMGVLSDSIQGNLIAAEPIRL
nr:hypothetical protein [Tanacetum cinerariifolium]